VPASSAATANFAKNVPAGSCVNRRRALQLNASVMRKTRDLFPLKTAQYLSDLTGYSVRTCEYWLSEKAVLPADALAALLKSEKGRDYLVSIMMDETPRWWLQLKAWWKAIDIRAAEIKHRRMLRELLDDAHPTTAQVLQDEDFYSGQPAPFSPLVKGRGR
jgi:hypothetical protein